MDGSGLEEKVAPGRRIKKASSRIMARKKRIRRAGARRRKRRRGNRRDNGFDGAEL